MEKPIIELYNNIAVTDRQILSEIIVPMLKIRFTIFPSYEVIAVGLLVNSLQLSQLKQRKSVF